MTTRTHIGWIERGIRRIRLPSGEERFRLQLGRRGRGNRTSRLCKTYQEAVALKEEWTRRGLPPPGAPPVSPQDDAVATIDDGFRHRVLDLEGRGKDSAVTERIRGFLDKHWAEGAALALSFVTVETVEEYRDRRLAKCKANTVVRELREWRAMLKKARPGFVLPNEVFPPEDLQRVRLLTPEEYDRVFPYLAERYGDVFAQLSQLALLGVMRLADVQFLKREYVRLAERKILLPRTKGGEPRQVQLSDEAAALVKRALVRQPHHDYVFANPRSGQPYSRVHISRCWRKAARECGLKDFTFHDLRHHVPTDAVNNGANTATLMAMGGWRSAKMVERYAHVGPETVGRYLNAAAARLKSHRPPSPLSGVSRNRSANIRLVNGGPKSKSLLSSARSRSQRSATR